MPNLPQIVIDPEQAPTDESFYSSCLAVTGLRFDDIQSFTNLVDLGRQNLDHVIHAWRKLKTAVTEASSKNSIHAAKVTSCRITQLRQSRSPAINNRRLAWLDHFPSTYVGSPTQHYDLNLLRENGTTCRYCGWCKHAHITEYHPASGAPLKGKCTLFGIDTIESFSTPMTVCKFQHASDLETVRHQLNAEKSQLAAYLKAIGCRIDYLVRASNLASDRPILSIWRDASYANIDQQKIVYFLDYQFQNPHVQQIYYIPTFGRVLRPENAHWAANVTRIRCNLQKHSFPDRYFETVNTNLQLMTDDDYQKFREDPEYFDFWLRHSTTDHNVPFHFDLESLEVALAGDLII